MITVNGRASAVVPATDRGLAYGDGVFRTLAVRAGHAIRWERQYAKLATDCGRLGIPCPPADTLLNEVMAVAARQPDCAVKIIVTRGESDRGYRVPERADPNRVVMSSPLPAYPEAYGSEGIAAWVCRIRLGTQPALAGVKHLNRLENVLARAEWSDGGYAEGILRDEHGNVISGTMTNLFIVERGHLYTPDLGRCGVAGVTRDVVLEAAARDGIPCSIGVISLDRAMACDEALLVNSLVGVWPVRSIGNTVMRSGGMTQRIRIWLDEPGPAG